MFFLALHGTGKVLCATADPQALRHFRTAALRDARSNVDNAADPVERRIAEERLRYLAAVLDAALNNNAPSALQASGTTA